MKEMTKEFTLPPESKKPPHPVETPYLRGAKEWDDRIGSARVQAKNWRVAFFGSSLLSLLLISGNLYQLTQQKLVPLVITLNKESGRPDVMGRLDNTHYKPELQEIKFFINQFIQKVRSVPDDPVLIKKNWLDAYAFLRRGAATALNELTNTDEDSPLKKIGQQTVTFKIISVVQVTGTESYQARWREKIFDRNGALLDDYTMTGVFTVEFETPSDEKTLYVNPLGIFIKSFQWNREL